MKRTLVLSALCVALLGGVASADRGHGRGHRGGVSLRGGVRVSAPRVVVQPRVVVKSRPVYVQRTRVVRRPIYVQAPAIRYRYYDYYQRPAILAENYAPVAGYYWVAGSWSWNGFEWIWTAGHYEPDPSYVEPYYDDGHYHDASCGHAY